MDELDDLKKRIKSRRTTPKETPTMVCRECKRPMRFLHQVRAGRHKRQNHFDCECGHKMMQTV